LRRLLILGGGLVGLVAVAIVALVVIQALRSDNPNLKTSAPDIVQGDTGTTPVSGNSTPASPGAAGGVFHFVIDSSGSEAKYVVREKLARLPSSSNAVGTTNAITGDLFLTTEGLASGQPTSFTVDLSKLATDESLRDNYVRNNVLQTRTYSNATFVASSITGFPASYVEGQEASMTLGGTLTIHGVSKQVDWTVKARRSGATLTGIADIDFNMSEFGIKPPEVPVAKAEDGVHLQITIVARQVET
jgi:polyisoprenoid-binding protein YceI